MQPEPHLSFRTYHGERRDEGHAFAQLVLPVAGGMEMDVGGRGARLDAATAAFVEPGTLHSLWVSGDNRSLIVDFDLSLAGDALAEQLARRTFLPISPAARRLVEFVDLSSGAVSGLARHWVPLLLDSLAAALPRPQSRLGVLLARLEAAPGAPWAVQDMARVAGLSVSRLHAVFQEELGRSPQAWLAELRLRRVQEWLAHTAEPVALIAQRAGYSDQSALTRAMRRATGMTPAAYRRHVQELQPKNR